MKTKKFLAVIAAAVLLCSLLAACGNGGSSSNDSGRSASGVNAQDLNGYDTGVFTVSLPDGWTAVAVEDKLQKYDGVTDPEQLYIVKGGTKAEDIFSYPYIWVSYYKDANTFASAKSMYQDSQDIEPLQIGARTWEGYKYTSSGYPGTSLTCREDGSLWACLFVLENNGKSISVQDEDVKTILSSLKVKQ